jgi:uncharacterized membrane protein YfhO
MNHEDSRGPRTDFFRGREFQIFLACLFVLVAFVFKDFLLLNKIYLFKDIGSDSVNGFYPNTYHVLDYLKTEGIPQWSFSRGMGQNIFPFSVSDPSLAIFYLFGRDSFAYGIVVVEVLKVAASGIFFFLYLRTIKLSSFTTVLGGLLYAFSGYQILTSSGWFNHSFEPFFAAVSLHAFELFFQRRILWPLPLAFAVIVSYAPIHLYLFSVFLFGYALVRYVQEREWQWKEALMFFARLAGLLFLGVGLASVFFLTNLGLLLDSPRVGGNLSSVAQLSAYPIFGLAKLDLLMSVFTRAFSNDLVGTADAFKGWGNYLESPMLYCGLISLLLAPQAIFLLRGRQRALCSVVAVVLLAPLFFPFFRYLFWGFTGSYFRTLSLFQTIALLLAALVALSTIERERRFSTFILASTLGICVVGLFAPAFAPKEVLDPRLRIAITGFLAIDVLLLYGVSATRWSSIAKLGLLALACVEIGWFSWITVNRRDAMSPAELRERRGYNDSTIETVEYLRAVDNNFYRIDKNYSSGPAEHPSLNDAETQRYFGTSSYHSFNQSSTIAFLQAVDLIPPGDEMSARWAVGLRGRPILESLAGVKYLLTKQPDARAELWGFKPVKMFGDVRLLINPNTLPLGFTYRRQLSREEFQKLSTDQKEQALMKACVVDGTNSDAVYRLVRLSPDSLHEKYSVREFSTDVAILRSDSLSITRHSQNRIEGTMKLAVRKLLCLSIPYDRGWQATVDGQPVSLERVNVGFMGIVLDRGEHRIELSYRSPFLVGGTFLSGLSLLLFIALIARSHRGDTRPPVQD